MSRSQLLGIEGSSYRAIETVEVLQPAFLIASCTIEVSSSSVTCSISASYETRVPPRMLDRLFAIDYGSRSTAKEISRSQLTALWPFKVVQRKCLAMDPSEQIRTRSASGQARDWVILDCTSAFSRKTKAIYGIPSSARHCSESAGGKSALFLITQGGRAS